MKNSEAKRIIKLFDDAIASNRSKKEAFEIFRDAGIITKKGNLRAPYKNIYIPSEK